MSVPTHPVDGDLQALLDGELSVLRRGAVQLHVDQCVTCRDRLAALVETWEGTHELLNLLAPPPPGLSLRTVTRAGGWARVRRAGLIAASVTLLLAAVASATVGRSYVRAVVARVQGWIHPAAPAPHRSEAPGSGQTGIAFVPGPLVEIAFDTPQAGGQLLVSFADTEEVTLLASAPVIYRVYPGGLAVHNRGSVSSYNLVVPRGVPHVRIVIASQVRFERIGSRITTTVPADSAGRYVLEIR
jgi:hypothetical protein